MWSIDVHSAQVLEGRGETTYTEALACGAKVLISPEPRCAHRVSVEESFDGEGPAQAQHTSSTTQLRKAAWGRLRALRAVLSVAQWGTGLLDSGQSKGAQGHVLP